MYIVIVLIVDADVEQIVCDIVINICFVLLLASKSLTRSTILNNPFP